MKELKQVKARPGEEKSELTDKWQENSMAKVTVTADGTTLACTADN